MLSRMANGIPIRYRFHRRLFNLRGLQAKSKMQTEVLDEFLFSDDMAKGAPTEEKMQKGVDQVSDSFDNYDFTISIKKTEVVYQPAPGKPYKKPTITLKGQRLQVVDKFTYTLILNKAVHFDFKITKKIIFILSQIYVSGRNVWPLEKVHFKYFQDELSGFHLTVHEKKNR